MPDEPRKHRFLAIEQVAEELDVSNLADARFMFTHCSLSCAAKPSAVPSQHGCSVSGSMFCDARLQTASRLAAVWTYQSPSAELCQRSATVAEAEFARFWAPCRVAHRFP